MSTVQDRDRRVSAIGLEPAAQHADKLNIQAVVYGNRAFHLRKPLTLHFQIEDGLCICDFEPLHIIAHGETVQEAFEAFQAEFAACWDGIAQEDDSRLTADACVLKKQLLKHVMSLQLLS